MGRRRAWTNPNAGQHAPALQGENEQTLVLELAAEARLAVGDVDAFDDLAAGGPEPTTEFHAK